MLKTVKVFFVFFVVSLTSQFAAGQALEVCIWQDSSEVMSLSTQGYTWGGSSFSTLEECGIALRATLVYVDFGQDDSSGKITFTDATDTASTCTLKQLKNRFSDPPSGFNDAMERAWNSQSSVKEISQFKSYLDENLQLSCP